MKLKDKIAIVTGGGSGIGRGVSLAYAREGAHIVVADINRQGAEETVARVEKAGRRGLAVPTDVSDPAQVSAMVAAAREAFGRIDILFTKTAAIYVSGAVLTVDGGYTAGME